MGADISTLIFNSIRDGAAVYYFKYYVIDNEGLKLSFIDSPFTLTTIYLVLGQAANIVGIILVTPISTRLGKKYAFFVAMIFAAMFSIVFYFMGANNVLLVMALQLFISTCAGMVFLLLWSMYADITDYSEWKLSDDGLSNRGASPVYKNGKLWIISNKSFFIIEPNSGKVIQQKELSANLDVTSTPLITDAEIIFGTAEKESLHWTNLIFS